MTFSFGGMYKHFPVTFHCSHTWQKLRRENLIAVIYAPNVFAELQEEMLSLRRMTRRDSGIFLH